MPARWRWIVGLVLRRLWFRATLISLLAVGSALISIVVAPYLPQGLSTKIGADSVDKILSIIASSMLAVTTFSLSTMVSAYSGATSNVTPRATKLLIEDSTAQNVLATFVGSFLYSLVALITLSTGAYGDRGRVVLFVMTIGVVLLIVITLLRWIDYLLRFGRVGETTAAVERAAGEALVARRQNLYLGGVPLSRREDVPATAVPVKSGAIGYVQHIAMDALQDAAEEAGATLYLVSGPGTFVGPGRPLAFIDGSSEEGLPDAVRDAFTVGKERTFDQDPRFGLSVLSEIASRALSPAINDPGTAIDVIGRAVRLLSLWADAPAPEEPRFPAIHVETIALDELFDDVFHPVARDGASIAEVQIRLQKGLQVLACLPDERFGEAARRHSRMALERALAALAFGEDRQVVERSAAWSG